MLELSRKLNKREKEEYVSICETVYGCIPVDVEWATSTEVYKAEKNKRFSVSEAKFSLTVGGLALVPPCTNFQFSTKLSGGTNAKPVL